MAGGTGGGSPDPAKILMEDFGANIDQRHQSAVY